MVERVTDSDLTILGGGLGGVSLASRLTTTGADFRLFEAKSRLGGRIYSLPSTDDNLCVDLGPTWFWPHQARICRLVDSLGLATFDQFVDGDVLYELSRGELERSQGTAGMQSRRIEGGTQALIRRLSESFRDDALLLSHRVIELTREEQNWCITFEHGDGVGCHYSPHLCLAIPPRVLVDTINVAQWLSPQLAAALTRTPTWMAAQAKFVATYRDAFWRDQGLAGDAFSRVGPMVEIHDASAAEDAGHALFGFIGVPATARSQLGRETLEKRCLQQLSALFGTRALAPERSYFYDWAFDDAIATSGDREELAPAHPSLDLTEFRDELDALCLSFAVSEASTQDAGYLEGALSAAEQAFSQFAARATADGGLN